MNENRSLQLIDEEECVNVILMEGNDAAIGYDYDSLGDPTEDGDVSVEYCFVVTMKELNIICCTSTFTIVCFSYYFLEIL